MKILLSGLAAGLGGLLAYSGFSSPEGPAWFHLFGMGASVVVLLVIWLSSAGEQPKGPPS
jgi:hypothetical protein